MNKKAISQMFTWIFIIIAGSLILIFFIRFAFQQTQIFGQKGSVELIASLEDQLEAFSVSEQSSKSVSLGYNTEVEFTCDQIVNENIPKRTNLLIFAPSKIKGKNLLTWTLNWEFPFSIANVYYIASEQSRYLLIYDKESFSQVASFNFPDFFSLQKINYDNLNLDDLAQNTRNLQNLNLIYFTQLKRPAEIFKKFTNTKVNIVQVDLKENQIKIFHPDGSFTASYFLEQPILYGAIFGPENFECVKNKAMERLDLLTQVYSQKAVHLSTKTEMPLCRAKYYEIKGSLDLLKDADSKQLLYELKDKVKTQNKALQKNACPTIY